MEPKAPLAKCSECPLAGERMVPGNGPDKAKIVLVGEAPGKDEVMQQKPFVGKSGQLTNKVLEYHGIKREDVYVTNSCLCRPPGNATPSAKAVAACNERLLAEVASREPERVVAVGAVAAQALLGTKERITALRSGGPKESPYSGYEVIPTFHPAAALRDPDKFPSIVGDIGKVNRVKVVWEHTKYKVIDTTERAIDFIDKQVHASKRLVLDVEIDHHASDVIRPDWLCIGISHRPGAAVVYTENVCKDPAFQQALRPYLEDPRIDWGYHNGQFDIKALWSFAPNARVSTDTILLHYMTDERKGTHDLEQVGSEILGAPNWKQHAKQYLKNKNSSLRDLPPAILYQYNAMDTDLTHRLIEPLTEMARKDGTLRPYNELLIPGTNVLAVAEHHGVEIDTEHLTSMEGFFQEKLHDSEAALRDIEDINPRSPQQVGAALESMGYPVSDTTKATLLSLKGHSNARVEAFVEALLTYKKHHKLESTYVRGLRRKTRFGRIHPTFKLYGTETGRLSSSEPNVQNIPRPDDDPDVPNIRDVFIAGEGQTLISCDYSQIEYRIAAALSGDPWLLEQFRSGDSLHKAVARGLFGPDYTENQYVTAKSVNFGILYEEGPGGLSGRLGISYKKASQLIEDWHTQASGIRPWQEKIRREVKENGHLTSHFDRKRRFWLITRDNWHHVSREALNFPVQSPASDLTLQSLIKLEPMLRGKATPTITVHDSLTFQCAEEDAMEVAAVIAETMANSEFSDTVPTPTDVKIGPRWGSGKEVEVVSG